MLADITERDRAIRNVERRLRIAESPSCPEGLAMTLCRLAIAGACSIAPTSYGDNLEYWGWYWSVRDRIVAIVQAMPRGD